MHKWQSHLERATDHTSLLVITLWSHMCSVIILQLYCDHDIFSGDCSQSIHISNFESHRSPSEKSSIFQSLGTLHSKGFLSKNLQNQVPLAQSIKMIFEQQKSET